MGGFRDYCSEPTSPKQHHSSRFGSFDAYLPKKVSGVPKDAEWLVRFGDKHWTDHLKKAAQDFKFHATLRPRLDNEIEDWHAAQPSDKPRTIVTRHPGTDTTGLGPPLSIRYAWPDEQDTDPTA